MDADNAQKPNPEHTPKSLEDAIYWGLQGPFKKVHANMKATLRDFLAQKFCVQTIKAKTPEQEIMLEQLWEAITGEKNFGKDTF